MSGNLLDTDCISEKGGQDAVVPSQKSPLLLRWSASEDILQTSELLQVLQCLETRFHRQALVDYTLDCLGVGARPEGLTKSLHFSGLE